MAAKKVTNNTVSRLGLPNGVVIEPKSTVQVEDWDKVQDNDVVKAWLEAEALTLGEPRKAENSGDEGESARGPRDSAGDDSNRLTDERARSSSALSGEGNEPIGTVKEGPKKDGDRVSVQGAKPWASADSGRSAAEAQASVAAAEERAKANKAKK